MPVRVRSVLLCEDLQQERLLAPVIERALGRRPRIERGAQPGGFTFVLRQLSQEIRFLRRASALEAKALVVVVDGDEKGMAARRRELEERVRAEGLDWDDRIVTCVPCRNVETWILWLGGADVLDEQRDFSHDVKNQPDGGAALARQGAAAWSRTETWGKSRAPLPALQAARQALTELAERLGA